MANSMNNKYWNSLAKDFTENVLEISAYDRRGVLKEEIALAAKKARVAADLGCGAGGLLELLSPRFKEVYALDYAAELLEQAKRRYNFSNVKFVHHNLTANKPLSFKADVSFCINALISPISDQRRKIVSCVRRATKPKGYSIFVVPSFESIFNTYHAMIRCQTRQGASRHKSVRRMASLYRSEVMLPVDGIVDIGGTPTKCFTQEEITTFLSDMGYEVLRIRKIEYPWDEVLNDVPRWLKDPYPWDWFILARKI